MPAVFTTYDIWNKRVPTPKLNRWLREMETLHPPPLAKGRRIRLRFMTQIKRRPPTFVLQVSQPEELGDDYLRYLMNRLRDDFGLPGVPIRLTMRKPQEPLRGPGDEALDAPWVVCALSHRQSVGKVKNPPVAALKGGSNGRRSIGQESGSGSRQSGGIASKGGLHGGGICGSRRGRGRNRPRLLCRRTVVLEPVIVKGRGGDGSPTVEMATQQIATYVDKIQRTGAREWRPPSFIDTEQALSIQIPGSSLSVDSVVREIVGVPSASASRRQSLYHRKPERNGSCRGCRDLGRPSAQAQDLRCQSGAGSSGQDVRVRRRRSDESHRPPVRRVLSAVCRGEAVPRLQAGRRIDKSGRRHEAAFGGSTPALQLHANAVGSRNHHLPRPQRRPAMGVLHIRQAASGASRSAGEGRFGSAVV